jgi:lysophospholipase L1-like esterase
LSEENRSGRFFERHPKKTLIIVSIAVFLGLDILIANTLEAVGIYDPPRKVQAGYRTRHPVYHHSLVPNTSSFETLWGYLEYRLYTNSLGFVDNVARHVELVAPGRRLILIGDSFTEGVGMSYADSFSGIVDKALAERGVEVLNAGVSSYSPIIYLRKIEHLIERGLTFDHLVVFIDISDIYDEVRRYKFDDQRNVVDRSPDGFGKRLRDWMSDNTIFYAYLRVWTRYLREDTKLDLLAGFAIDNSKARWTLEERPFELWGRAGLESAATHMDSLYRLSREQGFGLSIAVYPWPDQIWNADLDSRQVVFWQAWAKERDIPFINYFPLFIGDELDRDEVLKNYFIRGDFHWNEAGHALIAEGLLQHLDVVMLRSDGLRLPSAP